MPSISKAKENQIMATTYSATAPDFWQLTDEARKRGLLLLQATNEYPVTSASTVLPTSTAPVTAPVLAPFPTPAPLNFPTAEGRADGLAAAVEASFERLAARLAAGYTQGFLEVLHFFSRFHRYSARMVLLIMAQCPQASLVAGMKHWNQLGYRARGRRRSGSWPRSSPPQGGR